MNIAALLAQRATVQQRVAALAAIEAGGTALTAEQVADFEALQAEFNTITAQIERAQAAERMAAAAALPVDPTGRTATLPAQAKTPVAKGANLACMVMAIAHGGKNNQAAATYAEGMGFPEVAAALNKSTPSAGGYIVDPGYKAELIELLRAESVVRSSGARSVPMESGQMNMGRQNGGATAQYQGEGADIAKSEPTLGNLNMSAKKLTALVPVSNDLVRYSSPSALQIVIDDLRAVMGLREDLAFLRDNGTGDLVKGLRYACDPGNIIAANAVVNLQNITADAGKALVAVKRANVPVRELGWVMHPDVEQFLMDLRDGNGNIAFPELERGMFRGRPYKTTTQLPVNLGAGANETEIVLAEFSQVVIGDSLSMVLDVSTEATYMDGGSLVSAFSRDETVVRSVAAHDMSLRHTKAVAILTGVKWRY